MTLRAVDCQSFAGGFALGTVLAGFELVGKREMTGGFGVPNMLANRHLLGEDWDVQACDSADWEPVDVEYLFSNPPCSAWSTMSPKAFRGVDSPVTSCMWATVEYTARCMPEVAVFESVQPAYTKGSDLMRTLRTHLEDLTGKEWSLHHVLHSAASVGGTSATRKRYFWVASRVPFGVEPVRPKRIPSLRTIIGDLEDLPSTWEAQPYRRPAGWWARSKLREDGVVDGHEPRRSLGMDRIWELFPTAGEWAPGERLDDVLRRHYDLVGDLPQSWQAKKPRLLTKLGPDGKNFWCGVAAPKRWHYDRPAYVITGDGLNGVIHPTRYRGLTHREVARIMGFPDDWRIRPLRDFKGLPPTWGKGIPVECGRWISTWARNSINGEPGEMVGEMIGDREFLIDVTNDWRQAEVV